MRASDLRDMLAMVPPNCDVQIRLKAFSFPVDVDFTVEGMVGENQIILVPEEDVDIYDPIRP